MPPSPPPPTPTTAMSHHNPSSSVLSTLGIELIGVITPVSITMLLVILLVSSLSPSPSPSPSAATLIYSESPSDDTSTKLSGALLNALTFVALITVVTFLVVLLYYFRCTSFLTHYLRFSTFLVLSSMSAPILLELLRLTDLRLDSISFFLFLINFAVVGVIAVTSTGVPIVLKQSYLVVISVVVASWFTKLPEWTTWTILVGLSFYDLAAVLCPRGPLRILVELASSRDEELPALVYEARPTMPSVSHAVAVLGAGMASIEMQNINSGSADDEENRVEGSGIGEIYEENLPLVSNREGGDGQGLDYGENLSNQESGSRSDEVRVSVDSEESEWESDLFESSRGIRLGLGDFVFYSVLVGRAAMYDLMTVCACYLAIISGLGCTLILLAMWKHALPALPISITLGVIFYFLTRLLMEPFVVGSSTNLVMF